jgi:hypothetical protein
LRGKIDSHIALLEKLPEDSASRQLLLDHIDHLMRQMVAEETDAVSVKRRWDSIFLAMLGAAGFGVWAWTAPWLWLEIPLWVVAGFFAASLFGLLTTPKARKERESGDKRGASGAGSDGRGDLRAAR